MAIEIERKFQVINDRWRAAVRSSTLLRQGYLANTARASIRVRLAGVSALAASARPDRAGTGSALADSSASRIDNHPIGHVVPGAGLALGLLDLDPNSDR